MSTRILSAAVAAGMMMSVALVNTTVAQNTTTISFQEGVNNYSGTLDGQLELLTQDFSSTSMLLDGAPNTSERDDVMIRFDNILGPGAIPTNATILNAQLEFTTRNTGSGNEDTSDGYSVYRLIQPFTTSSTLDGDFGDGNNAFTPYVDGVLPHRDNNSTGMPQNEVDFNVGTFDHPIGAGFIDLGEKESATVTRAVQSWVNGDTNHGLAVVSDHNDNDDGWRVWSSRHTTPEDRPKLTVEYTTDPANVYEFQDGLNGYDGTTDVFPRQFDNSIDGASRFNAGIDGSDGGTSSFDDPLLIKFDTSAIDPTEQVLQAELILKTSLTAGGSDSPGPITVHQMLVDFDTSSVHADFAGDATAMQNAGQIGNEIARFESIDQGELMAAGVSEAVNNWLAGADNFGLYIGADTTNGWIVQSSGAPDINLRPMLRVVTIPELQPDGDFDNSGTWDLPDLNLVLFNWQQNEASLPVEWVNLRPATVGLESLNMVLFNWQQPSSLAVVPEPAGLALLLLGGLGPAFRRRRP